MSDVSCKDMVRDEGHEFKQSALEYIYALYIFLEITRNMNNYEI